jgi:hypothetical protein
MTFDVDRGDSRTLPPDEAFVALGSETRIKILRELQDADGPLAFSELRNRVGVDDPGQFNYHLGKLVGHFVRKDEDGYALRTAGTRIIEAVLAGAVTNAPVLEPSRLDAPCPYCGAEIEISYREERLLTRCTECPGSFAGSDASLAPFGTIALFDLPPVGLENRSPRDILDTAFRWTHLEYLTLAAGICPRCSGTVEHSVTVCEDHETSGDSLCEHCNGRFAVDATANCTTCPRYLRGVPSVFLISKTEVSRFLTDHGINPANPSWDRAPPAVMNYDEDISKMDPFEVRLTFEIDGDELTVAVDDTLSIVAVERSDATPET